MNEATSAPAPLRQPGAVRSRRDGAGRRGERAVLPRLVLEADVVEVPPPQGGGGLGAHPPRLLSRGALRRGRSRPTTRPSATATSSMRRRRACTSSTTAASSGRSSIPTSSQFNLETFRRDYTVDTPDAAADPFPLPRRCLRVLGLVDDGRPPRLPARGRHDVPPRHGPARARPVLAHHLRRADLAHDRHRRHRGLVHARPLLRRARRLSRRLGRPRHPAHDRDPALAARTAALARAVGGAAAELEPDPRLLRRSPSSSACSTGRASRGRCARSCCPCARRIS